MVKDEVKPSVTEKKASTISIKDFCYAHFKPLGRELFKAFKGVERDMEAANMKIHPEVYLSVIGFLAIVVFSSTIAFILTLLHFFNLPVWIRPLLYLPIILSPIMVTMVGLLIPKIMASNRISGLKIEIPYASMYMSVMANGGLSPYASLLRLRKMSLLPRLSDEIERIQRLFLSSGSDPVSAMEKATKAVGIKEYKELLLGYASTLRTGGDVLHYLFSQTEGMFRKMASRIKAMGENMGSLMEAYTIVGILGALGLYMVFVVSLSLPQAGAQLSPNSFFLFAFVLLPIASLVFIYFGDALQISYPKSCWKAYIAFAVTLPLWLLLMTQMALPFLFPEILIFPPLMDFTVYLTSRLGFEVGCEPALGLAFSLIIMAVPVVIVDRHYLAEERGILQGINSFLRDLVENRKTGLSPERCIQILSKRDYGHFSKHLKRISSGLSWGFPLLKIFKTFESKVKSWLAQINTRLLVDAIEVGGGGEESLETLAEFSESTMLMESERRSLLTPLLIVPYIGAGLLTTTTIMFLQFFRNMSTIVGGSIIPYVLLSRVLLTPLILHSFILGLVSGKIASGRVSAGFKHAILLTVISIIGIWLTSNTQFFGFFPEG